MQQKYLFFTFCATLLAVNGANAEESSAQDEANLNQVLIEESTPTLYTSKAHTRTLRDNIDPSERAKSVQIMNETLMQDTHVQNISDAIKLASNVSYLGDNNKMGERFAIRGFSGVPILRDGVSFLRSISSPEVFNLEAIEVLKGADSLQYGQTSPGGMINLVAKKPLREEYASFELELKSAKAGYAPKVDLGGLLSDNAYYRFVGIYRGEDSYKDVNTKTKRIFLAPSVAFDLGREHTLTLVGEYVKESTPTDFGTYVRSDGNLGTSYKTITSHPDEKFKKNQKVAGFDLESRFLSLHSNLKYRYIDYEFDFDRVYLPLIYDEANNRVTRYFSTQKFETSEHQLQYTLNLTRRFLESEHRFSFGADFSRSSDLRTSYVDRTPSGRYILDLNNPVYEPFTTLADHPNARPFGNTGKQLVTRKFGIFLQDNIKLNEELFINLGARYSRNLPQDSQNSDALTPQTGILYKLTPQTSLFASYSESFSPNSALDSSGKLLDPEKGKGMEMGIKQSFLNERLSLNGALFHITKENVALQDPNNPLASIASGEQVSKGIELDISGEVTQALSLILSYGYTKSEDKARNRGKELPGVPRHSANIFGTYYLDGLGLAGFYVGGGARYLGSRYANTTNTIKLPSALIYMLVAGYRKGNWRGSFSVQNITDKRYVESASNVDVRVGTPRTLFASLSYIF